MKMSHAFAGAALAALAVSQSATAATFSPPDTKIRLSGTVTGARNDRPQQCDGNLDGKTGAAGSSTAKITRATFTSAAGCPIVAVGLPWRLTATGPGAANLSGLAITLGGIACGPDTIPITVDGSGVWTIRATQMRGGCALLTALPSKPRITITP